MQTTDPKKPKKPVQADQNPFVDEDSVPPAQAPDTADASHNPFGDQNPFEDDTSVPPGTSDAVPEHPKKGLSGLASALKAATRGFAQEATMGFADEGTAALSKLGGQDYTTRRDYERQLDHQAQQDEPYFYNQGRALGALTPVAGISRLGGALGEVLRGSGFLARTATGAGMGALSGAGHSEAPSAGGVAADAGLSAALGATLANVPAMIEAPASKVGQFVSHLQDKFNPSRVVLRAVAQQMDPALSPGGSLGQLQHQNAMVPGSATVADVLPEETVGATTGNIGSNQAADVAAKANAQSRLAALTDNRRNIGQGFTDIEVDPNTGMHQMVTLSPAAEEAYANLGGQILPTNGRYSLAGIRDVTSPRAAQVRAADASKAGMGRAGYNRNQDIQTIYDELEQQLPGYRDLLRQYRQASGWEDRSQQLADALASKSAGHMGRQLSGQEGGSGGSIGISGGGFWARLGAKLLDPAPKDLAAASERMLFRPETAENTLSQALAMRNNNMQPPPSGPMALLHQLGQGATGGQPGSVFPALSGQAAGAAAATVAPTAPAPLSHDVQQAKGQAISAVRSGVTGNALRQQLATMYDPATVEFVMAALPNRLPQ